jgi:hypothetical protein
LQLELVRISTVFMHEPNLPLLLKSLGDKNYVIGHVRYQLDSATITFLEPPDTIAGRGTTRICYNFGRRTLSVESHLPTETLSAMKDVEEGFKQMGVNIEKALIPFEVTVVAEAKLRPKFAEKVYDFMDIFGLKLRLADGSLSLDGGDPNSNRWFHLNLTRVWSSYLATEKLHLYRLKLICRDERNKVFQLLEKLEDIMERLLKEV